MMKLDNGG